MQSKTENTTSRRIRLKEATQALHQGIDAQVEKSGFLQSREGYRAYVIRTFQARSKVESVLDRSEAEQIYPAWPARRLTPFLQEDLGDLGCPAELDPPVSVQKLDIGGVLGALYVLEGSSLGAKWIARRAVALGVDHRHGARHLARQTADPNAFDNFLHLLETTHLDAADEHDCLRTAIDTFACFGHSYDSVL